METGERVEAQQEYIARLEQALDERDGQMLARLDLNSAACSNLGRRLQELESKVDSLTQDIGRLESLIRTALEVASQAMEKG